MSRETENFEEPSTLPPPELNPLLNPLLGENMGRWAQAYFTSPPEKRDQAVQELLHELELEKSARAGSRVAGSRVDVPYSVTPVSVAPSSSPSAPMSSSSAPEQVSELSAAPASKLSEVQPTLVRCHACGKMSSSSQKFCGRCGSRLAETGSSSNLHRNDLHDENSQGDRRLEDRPLEDERTENARHLAPSFSANPEPRLSPTDRNFYEPSVHERRLNTNELSLFQSTSDADYYDDDLGDILSTPPASGSRFYVGFVLAIFIGVLAYLWWHSSQASQASHAPAPAPSAATAAEQPASSAPVAPVPPKTDAPGRVPSAENATAGAEAKRSLPKEPRRATANKPAAVAETAALSEKSSGSEGFAGAGTEELAVAQGYLAGTNGRSRNSAEGAKWLWKAVAKHNPQATFLLSDLYLRGDGVSKNCDQAHVLLDAATLKGVKGAGERLRHLQAFGCQ